MEHVIDPGRISEPRISEDFIRDQLPWGSAVVPRCLRQADLLLSDLLKAGGS